MATNDLETVTSAANSRLKLVRQLQNRRGRNKAGAFAVEGEDLVLAGLFSDWPARFVLVEDTALLASFEGRVPARDIAIVGEGLLSEVSTLGHPPRVIAVFDLPGGEGGWHPQVETIGPTLYLDGVRDPGNVGTAVRSAQALAGARVAIGPGTADPYSPKATRASMGAIFCTEVIAARAVDDVVVPGRQVVVLDPDAEHAIWDVDLGADPVICVGSEREGISSWLRARADVRVLIPQSGDALDSVNAGVAASLALYEWRRQRGDAFDDTPGDGHRVDGYDAGADAPADDPDVGEGWLLGEEGQAT